NVPGEILFHANAHPEYDPPLRQCATTKNRRKIGSYGNRGAAWNRDYRNDRQQKASVEGKSVPGWGCRLRSAVVEREPIEASDQRPSAGFWAALICLFFRRGGAA